MEYEEFIKNNIPNSFEDSLLHKQKILFLKKIKLEQNLLFYGYEGKRILINLYLKKIFKKKNIVIKKTINIINNKKFNYNYSDHHIEIDIKNLNKDEIIILVDFID